MDFRIKDTWDGLPVSHEPVTVGLRPENAGLRMKFVLISLLILQHHPESQGNRLVGCGTTREELPLEFEVTRMKSKWEGKVLLPWSFFPPCTDKFNALAIRGLGEERKYEALYPVPLQELQEAQEPDFHCLEFSQDLNLKELTGEDWKQPESDIWKSLTKSMD